MKRVHETVNQQFLSTPPRGERRAFIVSLSEVTIFLSTPPRGERRAFNASFTSSLVFLSTPPRGERPFVLLRQDTHKGISIHAPAWGATLLGFVRTAVR